MLRFNEMTSDELRAEAKEKSRELLSMQKADTNKLIQELLYIEKLLEERGEPIVKTK